jgi:hypothetical protein
MQLARETTALDPACVVDRSLARHMAAFRAQAQRIRALPDVIGVGTGEAPADARGTDAPCLRRLYETRVDERGVET